MWQSSDSARAFALEMQNTKNTSVDFEAQQRQTQISLIASNKSFRSVSSLLEEYNTGCKTCSLTQTEFAEGVGKANHILGNYLLTVDNGEAKMGGYIKSLVASKAATIGMQAATMALNMALSWGISALMSLAFTSIDNIIPREEKLIEKSEDAANAISSISSDFKSKSDTVKDIGKEFAELAQGVDALTGANKSLSTEDYERFLSLSNQLAEAFPTLSRNYDENGNAIVNLNGNVNTITDSLNALLDVERQLANQKIVDNLPDLYKGIKVKADNYKSEIEDYKARREELQYNYDLLSGSNIDDLVNQAIDGNILSISGTGQSVAELNSITEGFLKVLDEAGIQYAYSSSDMGADGNPTAHYYELLGLEYLSDEEIEALRKKIRAGFGDLSKVYADEINNLSKDIALAENNSKTNWSSLLSSLPAWLSGNDTYKVMEDGMQAVVQNMINGLDFDDLNFGSFEELTNYIITNIISELQNATPEVQQAIIELFKIKNAYESGEINTGEYKKRRDAAKGIIENSDLNPDTKDNIINNTGNDKVDKVESKLKFEGNEKEQFQALSSEDIEIGYGIVENSDGLSFSEFSKELDKAKKEAEKAAKANLSDIDILGDIEKLSNGLDQLDKIYADIKDKGDFDFSSILNNKDFNEAFSGYKEEYDNFIKTVTSNPDDLNACQGAFDGLVAAYIKGSGVLDNLTDSTRDATVEFLKQKGIANAAAIVDRQLAVNKAKLNYETIVGTNATHEDILAQADYINITQVEAQALLELAIAKMQVNQNVIITSGDIANLETLANKAGATTESLKRLAQAKIYASNAESMSQQAEAAKAKGLNGLAMKYSTAAEAWSKMAISESSKPIEYDQHHFTGGSATNGGSSSGGSGGSSDSSKVIDWIETAIDRIERGIDKLKNKASSAYKTLTNRFSVSKDLISSITSEIDLQTKAYNRYMSQANSVGLSEALRKKVHEGSIDITEYSGETSELIEEYKEWYENATLHSNVY